MCSLPPVEESKNEVECGITSECRALLVQACGLEKRVLEGPFAHLCVHVEMICSWPSAFTGCLFPDLSCGCR